MSRPSRTDVLSQIEGGLTALAGERRQLSEATSLFEGGLELDSFAVVELLGRLEEHFGIAFNDDDFTRIGSASAASRRSSRPGSRARNEEAHPPHRLADRAVGRLVDPQLPARARGHRPPPSGRAERLPRGRRRDVDQGRQRRAPPPASRDPREVDARARARRGDALPRTSSRSTTSKSSPRPERVTSLGSSSSATRATQSGRRSSEPRRSSTSTISSRSRTRGRCSTGRRTGSSSRARGSSARSSAPSASKTEKKRTT